MVSICFRTFCSMLLITYFFNLFYFWNCTFLILSNSTDIVLTIYFEFTSLSYWNDIKWILVLSNARIISIDIKWYDKCFPSYDKSNKLNGPELIPILQLMVLVDCDALAWPSRPSSYTFCVPSSMLMTSESLHSGTITGGQFLHGLVSSCTKRNRTRRSRYLAVTYVQRIQWTQHSSADQSGRGVKFRTMFYLCLKPCVILGRDMSKAGYIHCSNIAGVFSQIACWLNTQ